MDECWTVARKDQTQDSVVFFCFGQISVGAVRFYTGDWYGGLYAALLGVLGVQTSLKGGNRDMLKTFVVITFICGLSSGLEIVQLGLTHQYVFSHAYPLAKNVHN